MHCLAFLLELNSSSLEIGGVYNFDVCLDEGMKLVLVFVFGGAFLAVSKTRFSCCSFG